MKNGYFVASHTIGLIGCGDSSERIIDNGMNDQQADEEGMVGIETYAMSSRELRLARLRRSKGWE